MSPFSACSRARASERERANPANPVWQSQIPPSSRATGEGEGTNPHQPDPSYSEAHRPRGTPTGCELDRLPGTLPLRFKNITLGLSGPSVGLERVPSEREVLPPLFIELSNRRALLYPPAGRPLSHAPYIQHSVSDIRRALVEARKQLQGGRDAAEWVDAMTKACRAYLDAVEEFEHEAEVEPKFEPALRELREFFRTAATHSRDDYGLHEAGAFVRETYQDDLERLRELISQSDA
jgi:hypothetical protein